MRAFIDTNVLIYVYDTRDEDKQKTAENLIAYLLENSTACINMQVVEEFCSVAVNKLKIIDHSELATILRKSLIPMLRHAASPPFIYDAVRLHANNKLSFYDSLIIQAAIDTDCDVLYSEDLHDGQVFGKLKIVNPFKKI